MPLVKFAPSPGINTDQTSYSAEGQWVDCNLIRFYNGFPQQIGGWEKLAPSSFLGSCRQLIQWSTLDFKFYIGLGTHWKLYVFYSGAFYDVTPLRASRTLAVGAGSTWADLTGTWASYFSMTWAGTSGQTFTTGAVGSNLLLVHDVAHGCNQYDFVTFSGATSFDTLTTDQLNANHQIVGIAGPDDYVVQILGAVIGAAGATGGGAAVVAQYEIHVGTDYQVTGVGFGTGTFGRGTFGSSSSTAVVISKLRLWDLSTFGQDELSNVRYGGIYYWTASLGVGVRAVELQSIAGASKAPTLALQTLVTPERFAFALGCDEEGAEGTLDSLLVRWSSQENVLDWEERSTINTAGSYRLTKGNEIISGIYGLQRILIWTDLALFSATFEGPPYVWGFQQLSDSISIIGPNAAIEARNIIFWLDNNNFYAYDGTVRVLPCTVKSFVFDNINLQQKWKCFASINSLFSEVQWNFPSASSLENDLYVKYNFLNNLWDTGQLGRSARLDLAANGYPIATSRVQNGTDPNSTIGYLYRHETGYNADGAPMDSFVESSVFDIPSAGENYVFANRLIPDLVFRGASPMPSVKYTVKMRDYPGQALRTAATKAVTPTSLQQNIRARGRQMSVRVEGNDYDLGWRLGTTEIGVKPDGQK